LYIAQIPVTVSHFGTSLLSDASVFAAWKVGAPAVLLLGLRNIRNWNVGFGVESYYVAFAPNVV